MTELDDWVVNRQFGRLKVVKRLDDNTKATSKNLRAQVLVQCSCGQRLILPRYYLLRKPNPKTHCGCLGGPPPKDPRMHQTVELKPEYISWKMMRERCLNPLHISFKDYGGRGIQICERWLDANDGFKNFLEDMGLRPSMNHTLDRINVNLGYNPANCRWATSLEQAQNKRKKETI